MGSVREKIENAAASGATKLDLSECSLVHIGTQRYENYTQKIEALLAENVDES
jgi:hypothetical protein